MDKSPKPPAPDVIDVEASWGTAPDAPRRSGVQGPGGSYALPFVSSAELLAQQTRRLAEMQAELAARAREQLVAPAVEALADYDPEELMARNLESMRKTFSRIESLLSNPIPRPESAPPDPENPDVQLQRRQDDHGRDPLLPRG